MQTSRLRSVVDFNQSNGENCVRHEAAQEMRDRPLGAGLQEQAPNHLKLHWSRAVVVSVEEKARQWLCQMMSKETNANEPLTRCRKPLDDVKTRSTNYSRISSEGNLFTVWAASGIQVAWPWTRFWYGTWEPVVLMLREKLKWKSHKSQSTDVEHRGGTTRSSNELSVMERKPRGCIVQSYWLVNQ